MKIDMTLLARMMDQKSRKNHETAPAKRQSGVIIDKQSPVKNGDKATAPLSITFGRFGHSYCTHQRNHQTNGLGSGHYFTYYSEAWADFASRCKALGVPCPARSEGEQFAAEILSGIGC